MVNSRQVMQIFVNNCKFLCADSQCCGLCTHMHASSILWLCCTPLKIAQYFNFELVDMANVHSSHTLKTSEVHFGIM